MARRYRPPQDRTLQAFQFTLEPSREQRPVIRRQWGGRRYAFNWALRTIKADIDAYNSIGESSEAPTLYGLRRRWNKVKDAECADRETGEVWWPEISKEASPTASRAP